jgi:GDPmannose 4,6-dehydratase
MKKAFISGISGQDGAYLSKVLLEKGYKVYGGLRRASTNDLWRLDRLGIRSEIEIVEFELLDQSTIFKAINSIKPDEFYNLAAQSFVDISFKQPAYTASASGISVVYILDAIKEVSPETKFYQASTSEMFGKVIETPQNENTPFHPRSPYGVAKLFAHWTTVNHREIYNLFASSGILFNHESPLRGEGFVTRKITKGLVDIKNGKLDVLKLGNLDAKRDWGFAGDYCEGMFKILQHHSPDDFVLSTGESYSIRDFINKAAPIVGFEIEHTGEGTDLKIIDKKSNKTIIEIDKKFYRPCEVDLLIGDSTKARRELNWEPKFGFSELVEHMIDEEFKYSSK